MNLYKRINTWFKDEHNGYVPFLNNWLYFNATPYILGSVSMNMVAGDRVIKEDILGNKYKEIVLAMDFVTQYDAMGTSDINIDMIDELENFNEWIELKNTRKEFPDFGGNCKVMEIVVLTNVPSMLIDTTSNLAKYQIQIKFEYIQKANIEI